MAINSLFKLGNISNNLENFSNIQNFKKSLEDKNQERAKIFGYIGMEAYDLFKQNKISVPELESYFETMENLENEIEALENEKQKLEEINKKNPTCSCGAPISVRDKFCSKCGKQVKKNGNICTCGKKIEEGMTFCPNCGKSLLKDKEIEIQQVEKYKECICGAKVPEGQFMCMECGRKIKD